MAKSNSGYGRGTGRPHPIDIHVGARMRARRTLLGMNQTKLGDGLGVSFQQVQKYERGTNRIGSSRLFQLTRALDVSVEYFFEDMPPEVAASLSVKGRGRLEEPVSYEPDPMARRETLELVRAYYKIEDANLRKRLREMFKVLGAAGA